uniref:protein translocase subunit SecY n=1 Tax=Pachymeniopsis lanceolata TaxID=151733 RepID=UPI002A7F2863|nr:protein translocase subunit SecY [Pachymeniopsis lanceolata]WOL37255.1 protein translocase subunit SecY [Pachymeniopsis lanceolata]
MKTAIKFRKKILITLMILLFARMGIFIPIPGIDHDSLENSFGENGVINFLNIFSGGGFSTVGIFALGIVPYINSSIIMQLLSKIIPDLETLQKEEGEFGRQKITRITRYLTLLWAILQSIAIAFWIKPYVFTWNYSFIIDCTLTLTTGSLIIMWFSEIITEYGIGNGASLLIFQNIVSGIPKNFKNYTINIYSQETIAKMCVLLIFFVSMLILTVLVQEGTRKVLIVSARQLSKMNELNPQSYIPLKLNQGGVMPIIFASAAMALPTYLIKQLGTYKINSFLEIFLPNNILYLPIYCIFIVGFSYFYSSLVLNPEDLSKNLKKMGASIPNIRPGLDTTQYLEQIIYKLTLLGATFLFIIALVPSIVSNIMNVNTFRGLGATSLLILVSVAIDTAKQIQTYIISQQYDNIME